MRYFEKQSKLDLVQRVSKGVSRFTGAVTGKTLEKVKGARSKIDIAKNPGRYMRAIELTGKAQKAQKSARRATALGVGTVGTIGLLSK